MTAGTPLVCPKCHGAMERQALPEADVWRCRGCHGLWFGMRGQELLKARAREIDTGDPTKGARTDTTDRIVCPACGHGWRLVRMVDPQQPHIRFESCKHCYGRFYDAGEFADYAEYSWRDFIRDLKAPERL